MRLLFFRSDGCGICRAKAPLAREIARASGLPLEVIDVDQEGGRTRAESLRIRTVPTLAAVDGARVPFRLIGRMITAENVAHLLSMTGHPQSGG